MRTELRNISPLMLVALCVYSVVYKEIVLTGKGKSCPSGLNNSIDYPRLLTDLVHAWGCAILVHLHVFFQRNLSVAQLGATE